jgi:aspartate aminotransferase
VRVFQERRDLMLARMEGLPGFDVVPPAGAFYAFPKVSVEGRTDEDVAMELLKRGVVTVPGSAFGAMGKGHLRFSYATSSERIARGMDLVEAWAKGR